MEKLIANLPSFPTDPFEVVVLTLASIGAVHVLSEFLYIAWCIIRDIRAWL